MAASRPVAPRPVALVTGASGGIGEALAYALARDGYDLVLVARRAAALAAVSGRAAALGAEARTVVLDLQAPGAGAALAQAAAVGGARIDLLVNNAGYGLAGRFLRLDQDEQLGEVALNVAALTELTHRFVAPMRAGGFGQGVINVASTAAFQPGPHMAVYYATKAYVLSFTEALAQELKRTPLRAMALCPGPVATEFGARAGFDASMPLTRLLRPRSAEQVAAAALRGWRARRTVVIPGAREALAARAARFAPRPLLLAAVEQLQRRRAPD